MLYPTTFGTSLYECPSLWRTPKLTLAIILPAVVAAYYSPPDEQTKINKARLRFPTSKLCATNPRYQDCDRSRSAQVNSLRLVELSGAGNRDSRSVRPGRPPGEAADSESRTAIAYCHGDHGAVACVDPNVSDPNRL